MKRKIILGLTLLMSLGFASGCGNNQKPSVVHVDSVTLNENQHQMLNGENFLLNATVLPANSTDKSITWSVQPNSGVVTVNDGYITAVGVGEATVTVHTNDGDKTDACVITVKDIVHVNSITLNKTEIDLDAGNSETLIPTILPADATNKSVTWTVSPTAIASVSSSGVVTGLSEGDATVTATTTDGSKTATCIVHVKEKITNIKSVIYKDEHSLIDGNFYESPTKSGTFSEITDTGTDKSGYVYYNCSYGYVVRVKLTQNGYFRPTGLKVDGVEKTIDANGFVFFDAKDEFDTPTKDSFISLEVLFIDETPRTGDYNLAFVNSAHIILKAFADDKITSITQVNQKDIVYINPEISDDSFGVRSIIVSTVISDTGTVNEFEVKLDKDSGMYKFTVPFSHPSSLTITVKVEEIDITAFKGHELVGEYMTIRSYGLSHYDTYVSSFENNGDPYLTFNEAGEVNYKISSNPDAKPEMFYATFAENGIITAFVGTNKFEAYYSKNVMVIGKSSDGNQFATPLSNSKDIIVAVKKQDSSKIDEYSMTNFVFKVGDITYAVFNILFKGEKYATIFMNTNTKEIVFDVDIELYSGLTILDDKSIFEVYKNDECLVGLSYRGNGGRNDRVLLESPCGVYSDNNSNVLIIPNSDECTFNGNPYAITFNGNDITLKNSSEEYSITLYPDLKTFEITYHQEIEEKEVDFRGYTFAGSVYNDWEEGYLNVSLTFDEYKTDITGTLIITNGAKYYFKFNATFDANVNMLTFTIIEMGINGEKKNNFITVKDFTGLVADKQITFKSDFTSNPAYLIKNGVVKNRDFHL